ncbi:MAG: pyridoxal phosphate-dependent aminotransferase [Candidatus Woesearchaeota archaeon]
MKLSEKIGSIEKSGTIEFVPLIEKLEIQGKDIINFAVGEPDFETPDNIIEATKKALDENKTRYSDVSGIIELRKAVSERLSREHNLMYNEENVMISNGSKHALYNAFHAICNPHDEVIIPRPYWVSFAEQVKLVDAKPIFTDTIGHQLDIEKIKKSISNKTKAIIINSPNNPTGAVYKKDDLKAITDLALDNNFYIVSDETYESMIYDGIKHFSAGSLSEEVKDITLTIKSFSKEFSMTGFRVGYVAAEKNIIDTMNNLQGHVTGNVCTFSQYGALAALSIDKSIIKKRVSILEKRRDMAYKLTKKLFDCIKPEGAFYLFPNVESALGSIKSSEELASYFIEKAGVAVVPGEVFGVKNHIRISYALPEEEIKKGFEKISKLL